MWDIVKFPQFPKKRHNIITVDLPRSPAVRDFKRSVCRKIVDEFLGGENDKHGLTVEAMAQNALLRIAVRDDATGTTTYRDYSENDTVHGRAARGGPLQLIFRSDEMAVRVDETATHVHEARIAIAHAKREEAARQAALHVVKTEPNSTKPGRNKRKRVERRHLDVYRENVERATILLLGYVQARRDSSAGLALPPESAMLANLPEQAMREILRTIMTCVGSLQFDVTAENNGHSEYGDLGIEGISRSVSATLRMHGKDGFVRIQAKDYGDFEGSLESSCVLVKCICPQPAPTASVAAAATETASEDESSLWEHLLQIEFDENRGIDDPPPPVVLKVFENLTLLERMRSQLALDELLTLEETFAVTVLSLVYPDKVKGGGGGGSRCPSWNLARCAFYPDENANDSPRFASSMLPRSYLKSLASGNSEPEVVATPFREW